MREINMRPLVRVVDDDEELRESLVFLLHIEGWEAVGYGSAEQFLSDYMPSRSGCNVIDVRMPGMDGLELFERLNELQSEVPIIFLTAHGDIDMAVHVLRHGAVNFLQKPIEPQKFVAAVAEAVEVDRKRRNQIPDVQEAKQLMGRLTKREVQILRLLSRGLLNQEVASALGISQRTVEAHRASIYHKVGKKSIAQISEMLMIAS